MITMQETTAWNNNTPNHKYIVSDDRRTVYGFIPAGDKYPKLFDQPIKFFPQGREFRVVAWTTDVVESNTKTWVVKGSKGNKYTVTCEDGVYSCTCPRAVYRREECKHIKQVVANESKTNKGKSS